MSHRDIPLNAATRGLWLAVAGAGLLELSWLAVNHYPPWVAAHSELLAACSIAVVYASVVFYSCRRGLYLPRAALFFFVLASISMLQVASGLIYFFGDGWIATLYLIAVGFAVVASAQAFRYWGVRWVNALAGVILTGAIANLLIALMQRFDVVFDVLGLYVAMLPPGKAPFGNLAQPNQLNTLFALGLVSLWWFFERRQVSACLAIICAGMLVSGMALTLSRTSILFFPVLLASREVLRRRVPIRTSLSIVLCLALWWLVSFVVWPQLVEWVNLTSGAPIADRLRAGPRTVMWAQLVEALWTQPLWGFGWNQVNVAQLAVVEHYPDSRFTLHSHNLVLDLLLWNGIPLGLTILFLSSHWLVVRATRITTLEGGLALCVISLLLTHAQVEYPLDYLYFLAPFGMMLGVLSVDSNENPAGSIGILKARSLVVTGIAIIVITSIDYWRMEDAFRETRFEAARIGPSRADALAPAVFTGFTQLEAQRRFLMTAPRPGMSAAELQWMGEVTKRYAAAPMLYRYALAQALNNDIKGAELTLKCLEQLHGMHQLRAAQQEIRLLSELDYPQLRALSFLH